MNEKIKRKEGRKGGQERWLQCDMNESEIVNYAGALQVRREEYGITKKLSHESRCFAAWATSREICTGRGSGEGRIVRLRSE